MRLEYDYDSCASFRLCTPEWDAIENETDGSKVDIEGTVESDGVFHREIPAGEEDAAIAAAKSCPVDAIELYDDDGTRIVP